MHLFVSLPSAEYHVHLEINAEIRAQVDGAVQESRKMADDHVGALLRYWCDNPEKTPIESAGILLIDIMERNGQVDWTTSPDMIVNIRDEGDGLDVCSEVLAGGLTFTPDPAEKLEPGCTLLVTGDKADAYLCFGINAQSRRSIDSAVDFLREQEEHHVANLLREWAMKGRETTEEDEQVAVAAIVFLIEQVIENIDWDTIGDMFINCRSYTDGEQVGLSFKPQFISGRLAPRVVH